MEIKKNKTLEIIKTILIIFLILFACYQLFDMNSDVSLLELMTQSLEKTDENNEYYLKPESIMISLGNKEYVSINYGSNQDVLIKTYLNDIYKEIFNSKKSLEVSRDNIDELVNEKSIIAIYGDYNEDITSELFDITNDKVLKSINKIEKVIIVPSEKSEVKSKVYFCKNENTYSYETSIDTIELYGLIDEINLFSQMNIYDFSENLDARSYFNGYVFLPNFENDFSIISNDEYIELTNPFIDNGEVDETLIENYANLFFDNPKAKWKMEKDTNVLIFGDGEKTISIYNDGYVNYTYSLVNEKNINLKEAIKVASEKISLDTYLAGNVILSDVRKVNDSTYEFSYNYLINNCLVMYSNAILNKYKMDYPLKVIVQGDEVINYKALLLKFKNNKIIDELDSEITIDEKEKKTYEIRTYQDIITELTGIYPDIKIKDFKMGYYKQGNDDAKLMWMVKTNEGTFTYGVR